MNKRIIFGGEAGQPFAVEYGIHVNDQSIDNRAEIIIYQDMGPHGKLATSLHDHPSLTYIAQKIVDQNLAGVRSRFIDFFLVQNILDIGLIARQYEDVISLDTLDTDRICLGGVKELPAGKAESLLLSIGVQKPESFE